MACIFLFAFFSIFAVTLTSGSFTTTTTVTTGAPAALGTHEEVEGPNPELSVCCWDTTTKSPPWFDMWFGDDLALEQGWYIVDDDANLSDTETEGWVLVFNASEDETLEVWLELQLDADLWEGLAEGSHHLITKVWDNDTNVMHSDPIWFFKDTIAPSSVQITAPANGTTVSDKITIEVEAEDNDGGSGISCVALYVGTHGEHEFIYEDCEAPFVIEIDLSTGETKSGEGDEIPEGTYTFFVKAYDDAGNYAQSDLLQITIKYKDNSTMLIIILVTVGATAAVATTFVYRSRRQSRSFERTATKLGKVKQPMGAKTGATTEVGEATYVIPDYEGISEVTETVNQLPLSAAEKQALLVELQGLSNGDRAAMLTSILGSTSAIEAQNKLPAVMQELETLEKEGKWSELDKKLDEGLELAELAGDQAAFNTLLTKLDELKAAKKL
jgi:hypothetical protein